MNKIIRICIITISWLFIVTSGSCNNSDTISNSTPLISSTPLNTSSIEHGCEGSESLPDSRPSDFNLMFKYGYGTVNKNVLDTFDGTYTKDLYADPPVTIDFILSDEDMDRIYQMMLAIDFFCYPDTFVIIVPDGETIAIREPYLGYYFQVVCDQKIKVLRWEDKIFSAGEDAKNLRSLISLIRNIIETKNEYRELPAPKGAVS